ncbi:peptidoglycan-binding domain-containing protein [Niallia circulans]|uniref:Peptidoglycan-binding protein n=1 Tax=Niallia circulans TaxID=1397 RepID=A0A941GGF0_NIACI|nr:peptidoglycan-binding domain-containing protein [Niallia circulans]MCB5239784.1 peptidoglycan-binding protein [Niallia circulans]
MLFKKSLAIILSSAILVSTVGTTYATAAELKESSKVLVASTDENDAITVSATNGSLTIEEAPIEEDSIITPMYISGNFWGVVFKFILSAIASEIVTTNYTIFTNWLANKAEKWGGDKNGDAYVKINGHEFSASAASNMVGDGKANQSVRVKDLQVALTDLGYPCGTIDGKWGPKTKAALIKFQTNKKLSADGIAGKNTWRKLAVK